MALIGNTATAQSIRPLGLLESVTNEANSLLDGVENSIANLESLSDRIFGPSPQEPSGADIQKTNCAADSFSAVLRRHKYAADRLVRVIERLQQLA